MRDKNDQDRFCAVCGRLHNDEQHCPKRIANALMMQPRGLESLTHVDKEWMVEHQFSIVDLVEGTVASMV